MYASSALSVEQRAALLTQPSLLKAAVDSMYGNHSDIFGGRRTNAADARKRNDRADQALSAALKQIED
jgi:hypothetical protein